MDQTLQNVSRFLIIDGSLVKRLEFLKCQLGIDFFYVFKISITSKEFGLAYKQKNITSFMLSIILISHKCLISL